jgi:uncharacterized delta-60 repeat protein
VAIRDLVVRPNGRIVAVGSSGRYSPHGHDQFLVAQLTTAGALDTSFGQAGISTAGDGTMARSAVLLDDGSVVVAGRDYPREGGFKGPDGFILAKWTPTGSLDTGFGTGGVAIEERFSWSRGGLRHRRRARRQAGHRRRGPRHDRRVAPRPL